MSADGVRGGGDSRESTRNGLFSVAGSGGSTGSASPPSTDASCLARVGLSWVLHWRMGI